MEADKTCHAKERIKTFLRSKALFILLFTLSLLFSSCAGAPYRGEDLYTAREFLLDSYKIREGKFSILEMEGEPLIPLDKTLFQEYEVRIDEGDLLEIAIYAAPNRELSDAVQTIDASTGYVVRQGAIFLPEIGSLRVEGLTILQAEHEIGSGYLQKREKVQVFLSIKKSPKKRVQLAGMVGESSLLVDGKKRLFELLAEAKVSPQANLFKSYLTRGGDLLPVDMHKLLKGGDMSQNIVMRPGDQIYIAENSASTLTVLGEVNQPKQIPLPSGSMPLRNVLALAGGITKSGDRNLIQVMRGSLPSPKIYTLSWEQMVRLPTSSFLVMPGDTVYVAATPIAQWSRFVSQIFPTLVGIELFRKEIPKVIPID